MQKVQCFPWKNRAGPRFLGKGVFSGLKRQNCQ